MIRRGQFAPGLGGVVAIVTAVLGPFAAVTRITAVIAFVVTAFVALVAVITLGGVGLSVRGPGLPALPDRGPPRRARAAVAFAGGAVLTGEAEDTLEPSSPRQHRSRGLGARQRSGAGRRRHTIGLGPLARRAVRPRRCRVTGRSIASIAEIVSHRPSLKFRTASRLPRLDRERNAAPNRGGENEHDSASKTGTTDFIALR